MDVAAAGLAYPQIDPVLVELGPFAIRWYALSYIAGILLGWRLCLHLLKRQGAGITQALFDDYLFWAIIGIIGGGRLGYTLFYQPGYYLTHPAEILFVWQGGMSFHGGLIGVLLAAAIFCHKRGLRFLDLGDLLAVAAPIGIGLGRIANFINAELVGRPTDVPWGMAFPGYEQLRHPSQLYEAALEGLVLFLVMLVLAYRTPLLQRRGGLSGAFLTGYALARGFCELFRRPDPFLGTFFGGATMGQLLSAPMLVAGLILLARALRRPPRPAEAGS